MINETAKKRPPSYYRYKQKHPPVTITLTRDLKQLLDDVRGEKSYGVAMKGIITGALNPAQELKKQLEAQHARDCETIEHSAKVLVQRVLIPCPKCKKSMEFDRSHPAWPEIVKVLQKAFPQYRCRTCTETERKKKSTPPRFGTYG